MPWSERAILMEMPHDPFDSPMIFLRVAWMTRYAGIAGGDTPVGGGAFVAEHGFGHEIFNFQPFQNAVFGYAQPPGRKDKWSDAKINLTRLDSSANGSVSGVLAVWVSTASTGGAFVVGWYKNATVFREWQPPPPGSNRRHKETDCGYYVTAKSGDTVLLAPDERIFPVPQQEKGTFGQSNIWYADDPEQNREFRLKVLQYIQTRRVPSTPEGETPPPRQPDPLLRQKVEQIAVERTTAHFTGLGYTVDSFEQDNLGWDLTAVSGKRELRLEVKGLSGSQIVVELTPNEYAAMKQHRDSYRVCVVTNALTEPCLEIFAYTPDSGQWESQSPERRVLNIKEIIAARCKVGG